MSVRHDRFFRGFTRFGKDDAGTISSEWMIAVALVVGMAVPVMALISDGSEQQSGDVVVSIQETSGKSGAASGSGQRSAESQEPDEKLFVPGSHLGVGFPDAGEDEGDRANRPSFFAASTETMSRGGGSGGSSSGAFGLASGGAGGGGTGGATGGGSAPTLVAGSGGAKSAVPEAGAGQGLAYRAEHCIEPVQREETHKPDMTYVVASGR